MPAKPLVVRRLTPAEDVEPDERLGWFEGVADELVKVEAFTEHPAVRTGRRVDLGERQHSTPYLQGESKKQPLQWRF